MPGKIAEGGDRHLGADGFVNPARRHFPGETVTLRGTHPFGVALVRGQDGHHLPVRPGCTQVLTQVLVQVLAVWAARAKSTAASLGTSSDMASYLAAWPDSPRSGVIRCRGPGEGLEYPVSLGAERSCRRAPAAQAMVCRTSTIDPAALTHEQQRYGRSRPGQGQRQGTSCSHHGGVGGAVVRSC
jgi:hypothetical protein